MNIALALTYSPDTVRFKHDTTASGSHCNGHMRQATHLWHNDTFHFINATPRQHKLLAEKCSMTGSNYDRRCQCSFTSIAGTAP